MATRTGSEDFLVSAAGGILSNNSVTVNDLIGKPFELGAHGPDKYDCHGLVIEVFKRFGIDFPDVDIAGMAVEKISATLSEQVHDHVNVLKDWEEVKEPVSPCLVIIKGHERFVSHLGVYLGNGRFIHSRQGGSGVCVERISNPGRIKNVRGFFRYAGKDIH